MEDGFLFGIEQDITIVENGLWNEWTQHMTLPLL